MRIYTDALVAFRETEREVYEMGLDVQVQTMQDKHVADNPDYLTKELQGYAFKLSDVAWNPNTEVRIINYAVTNDAEEPSPQGSGIVRYIDAEFKDRVGGVSLNPGRSYLNRLHVWSEFLHDGKFSYTYSERITPQLAKILNELRVRPATRQAIINIHSNIAPYSAKDPHDGTNMVLRSADLNNTGGNGRIPCSMYYQFMRRNGKLDMIYAMRSCDFLTHFPVDLCLAMRMQAYVAREVGDAVGQFTYFTGSMHAYAKDMKVRGIF